MGIEHVYFGDLVKSEKDENGDLIVYGRAANPTVDIDRQVADPEWLKTAMPAWQTWGNVREQHSKIAAGIGIELQAKGDDWWLKSAVIDEGTARKVEKGVLKGYSIGIKGPRVVKDAAAPGGRIVGGEIVEISLVDRPANPDCLIDIAKAAGGDWQPVDADLTKSTHGAFSGTHNHLPDAAGSQGEDDEHKHSHSHDDDGDHGHSHSADKAADSDKVDCPTCKGDGKIMGNKRKCPDCGGDGKVSPAKAKELKSDKAATPGDVLAAIVELSALDLESADETTKAVVAELVKRSFNTGQRKAMAAKGQAMAGGGFPIATVEDLKNAIQAIGRAKDPAKAKAHIKSRAAALGKSSLVPDSWKAVDADLDKATDDTWTHDPAQLTAVRDSIAQLMQAELDELMAGEPELWDLSDLLQTLQQFICWWNHEAAEGEVPPPGPDQGDSDMDVINLGVNPDLVKAATADGATDDDRAAVKADLLKSLGLDRESLTEVLKEVVPDTVKGLFEERDKALEERLKRVETTQAPGGPLTTRPAADAEKATKADQLRAEIAEYRAYADRMTDREAASIYRTKAAEAQKELATLA
jgi:hypothetical protein